MAQRITINGDENKGQFLLEQIRRDAAQDKDFSLGEFSSINLTIQPQKRATSKLGVFYRKALRKLCRIQLTKEVAKALDGEDREEKIIKIMIKIAIYTAQIEGMDI